ncbi:MAG: SusC/RagA family TonB-linked outer membrane protein [Gemmatimonadota bacterium]
MSHRSRLLTLAVLLLAPVTAWAQNASVTGRVTDANNQQAIAGAQVFVVGTTRGTLTDQEGRYRISDLPAGPTSVRVVIIGYESPTREVTLTAGATATVDFALATSAVALDQVVVNAITGQAERKREVGTNVSTIPVAELNKGTITRFTDVLTGRATGLNLQSVAGTTGTSQRVRIRGANSLSLSNEPLIYVDGVQFSNSKGLALGVGGQDVSRLNDINPNDIENIEILKGPAASALYGTAAANGVLLITTKRGKTGRSIWNAYAESGVIEDRTDYPDNFLAYQLNTPGAPVFTSAATPAFDRAARAPCFNFRAATGACRQDSTFVFNTLRDPRTSPFQEGDRQKYGINVSGGGDALTYFLSGDFEDEIGVIDYNRLDKASFRANLNARLRENLRVQVTTGYVDSKVDLNSNDNSIFSPLINGLLGGAVFFPNVNDTTLNFRNYGFNFSQKDLREYITEQEVDRFTGGVNANYQPLSWLNINANAGLDYVNRHDLRTLQPNRLPIAQSFTVGQRSSNRSNTYLYTLNSSGSAIFSLRPDLISTSTLGVSYQRNLFESTSGFGAGIVEGTRSLGGTTQLFNVDEDFSEIITIGGFVRQQLAWRDRVFLGASVRGDDNSAFGTDFGFIYYPSVDVSWVVADEEWFPDLPQLSTLRLRTAYGESGQRPDFRSAQTFFTTVAVTTNNATTAGVTLSGTGNVDLKPEKTREIELGFDAGLFNDRLSFDVTYYNKRSRDALISRRLPPSFGLTSSVFANLGSIRNSGTEIGVMADVINRGNVSLNLRISATTVDNEIEDIGEGIEPIIFGRGTQRHQNGFPAGAFFQAPITINDANNDGKLALDEVTVGDTAQFIGPSLPTFNRSISGQLTLFRYITIATLFDWRGGNFQLNSTESFRCGRGFAIGERGCAATGDPNASLEEQARFIAAIFKGSNAGYIEDAEFVKWRELSLTLGTPEWLVARINALRGASLTLAGRNLKTWTDSSGLEPEINESGGDTNFTQNEFNTQPPVRTLSARLNFVF